jgi:cell division septum initiation protein DivIVA
MAVYQHEQPSPEAPPEASPRLEDIPFATHGLDPERVGEAFAAFNRQLSWYRSRPGTMLPAIPAEPAGGDLRADAMRLIRAAVEFADVVERDAQEVACRQVEQAQTAIQQRESELEAREAALRAELNELEARRAAVILAARHEAEEIVGAARVEANETRRDVEADRRRIIEECRHYATELANASRADVERTLEWARAQAEAIVRRGRTVAEQLVAASLRGNGDVAEVINAVVRAAEVQVGDPPEVLRVTAQPALPAAPQPPDSPAPRAAPWQAGGSDDDRREPVVPRPSSPLPHGA